MFHYFESKEQLYEELVRMGVEGANQPMEMNFSNPLDYFTGFISAMLSYAKEQPWVFHMFVLMAQARRSDSIPAHIRELAMSVNQIEQSAEIIAAGQQYGFSAAATPMPLPLPSGAACRASWSRLPSRPKCCREKRSFPVRNGSSI